MNTSQKGEQYNKIGKEYIAQQEKFFHEDDWSRKLILERLGEIVGQNVVDAGCGHGVETRLLLQGNPKHVTAFDPSETMLNEAKKRTSSPLVTFVSADFSSIPEEGDSVDTLVACFSLHYMENLDDAHHEVFRVLKKGGRAIFVVPHPDDSRIRSRNDFVQVKLYDKVEVTYPAHTKEEYFSSFVQEHFDINDVEEKIIPEVSADIPAVLVYTLTKK